MNLRSSVMTANRKIFFSVSIVKGFKIFWIGIPSHPTTYFCSRQLKSYSYKTESRRRYSNFKYGHTEDTMNLDGVLS